MAEPDFKHFVMMSADDQLPWGFRGFIRSTTGGYARIVLTDCVSRIAYAVCGIEFFPSTSSLQNHSAIYLFDFS